MAAARRRGLEAEILACLALVRVTWLSSRPSGSICCGRGSGCPGSTLPSISAQGSAEASMQI